VQAHVVVDVGNSRIKWGRCSASSVAAMAALPHGDAVAWQAQFDTWKLLPGMTWVVSGVAPSARDILIAWLRERQQIVHVLDSYRQLPLNVEVDFPDQVGIDRLLNAVAANSRRAPDQSVAVIDAGSAVTLNWIDRIGAYRGGAIFPGIRLMAQALHQNTALLPFVDVTTPLPPLPATNTRAAIEAGVYWAVTGGIRTLIERLPETPSSVFLTGGNARRLSPALDERFFLWPEMTLEGIRLAAQSLS
jgi:type III pantothenate kinase